ncbi:MAG: extracellular solute-binding protein [Candidatus Aerophobetes bacterium]
MRTKTIFAIMVCCLAFTVLFAFSVAVAADIEAAKKEGKVIFYTSMDSKTANKLGEMFTDKYGIAVDVFRTGTGKVITKIEAELRAKKVMLDVVQHSDPATFEIWKARDLLYKYTPEGVDKFYDFARDPDGYWFAVKSNTTLIAYNPTLIKGADIPRSWKDITDPKWKGKLSMSNPYYAGSVKMSVSVILPIYGWDYYEAIGKNDPYIGSSHSGLRTLCIAGEYPLIAPMNSYHVFQVVYDKPESPIAVSYPEEGSVFVAGPAAIFEGSAHPNAAELFMDFMCSEEAQRVFADRAYYPGLKGVYPVGQPRLGDMKLLLPDYDWIIENSEEVIATFDETVRKFRK